MLDIGICYQKLADKEAISEDETVALLKELAHFRRAVAYLASCQASTLEALPQSASKSIRSRMVARCDMAAKLLSGDASQVLYGIDVDQVRERCINAAAAHGLK